MSSNAITEQKNIEKYAEEHMHQYINKNGEWETYSDPSKVNQSMVLLENDAKEAIAKIEASATSQNATATQKDADQILGNYYAEQYEVGEMKDLADLDVNFNAGIQYDSKYEEDVVTFYGSFLKNWKSNGSYTLVPKSEANSLETSFAFDETFVHEHADALKDESDANAYVTQIEKSLKASNKDETLSDLIAALNGLTTDHVRIKDHINVYLDKTTADKEINDLTKMIKEQIEIDANNSHIKNKSGQDVESDYEAIIAESEQSEMIAQMESVLKTDDTQTNTQENTLNDHVNVIGKGTLGMILGSYTDYAAKFGVKEKKALLSAIEKAENLLVPAQADVDMRSLNTIMDNITSLINSMKELLAKIGNHPTQADKAKLGKLLQFLLAFVDIFIQEVENSRAKNKQRMSSANIAAQKINLKTIKNNLTESKKIQKAQKSAAKFQTALKWLDTSLTAIFALTGNFGMAAMMGTMLVLQQTGTLKKWTNDLASSEGGSQADGALSLAAITMAISMVGAVGIDLAVERVVSQVASVTTENMTVDLSKILPDSFTKEDAQQNPQILQSYESLVRTTTERAAKEASTVFYKKVSLGTLLRRMVRFLPEKVGLAKSETALKEEMKIFAEANAKKAYEKAIKKVKVTIKSSPNTIITDETAGSFAKDVCYDLFETEDQMLFKDTRKDLDDLINKVTSKSPRLRYVSSALRSGLTAGIYMIATTNVYTDAYSEDHKNDKKAGIMVLLDLVQAITQMIALASGGMAETMKSSSVSDGLSTVLAGSAIMQTGAQGAQAGCSYEMSLLDSGKAQATYKAKETTAYDAELNTLAKEDAASTESSCLTMERKRIEQEQSYLANNLWNNMRAASEVLRAQAV